MFIFFISTCFGVHKTTKRFLLLIFFSCSWTHSCWNFNSATLHHFTLILWQQNCPKMVKLGFMWSTWPENRVGSKSRPEPTLYFLTETKQIQHLNHVLRPSFHVVIVDITSPFLSRIFIDKICSNSSSSSDGLFCKRWTIFLTAVNSY